MSKCCRICCLMVSVLLLSGTNLAMAGYGDEDEYIMPPTEETNSSSEYLGDDLARKCVIEYNRLVKLGSYGDVSWYNNNCARKSAVEAQEATHNLNRGR